MVEAANLSNSNYGTHCRQLYWPTVRRVFADRQVCPRTMVVRKVALQDAAQVMFVEYDDMI